MTTANRQTGQTGSLARRRRLFDLASYPVGQLSVPSRRYGRVGQPRRSAYHAAAPRITRWIASGKFLSSRPPRHHRGHHRVPADLQYGPSAHRAALAWAAFGFVHGRHSGGRDSRCRRHLLAAPVGHDRAFLAAGEPRLSVQAHVVGADYGRGRIHREATGARVARNGRSDRLDARSSGAWRSLRSRRMPRASRKATA